MPLKLGDSQTIEYLSDPTYFSILKPKSLPSGKKKYPLILLVGEIHGEVINGCSPSPLYSSLDLIKSLDSYNGTKYIIDFFVEQQFHKLEKKKRRQEPIFLEENKKDHGSDPLIIFQDFSDCYKQIKEGNCPTRNIHWHYIDLRGCKDSKPLIHDTYKKPLEECVLSSVLEKFINPNNSVEGYIMTEEDLYSIFMESNDAVLNVIENIHETGKIDMLFDGHFSLLSKELSKVTEYPTEQLVSYFQKYFDNLVSKEEEKINKEHNFYTKNHKFIKKIGGSIHQNTLELIYTTDSKKKLAINYILYQCILEFYFILRLLKNSEDDRETVINVSYLGAGHSKRIQYFFTDILKLYDIVDFWNSEKNDKIKCIHFEKDYNIETLVQEQFSDFKFTVKLDGSKRRGSRGGRGKRSNKGKRRSDGKGTKGKRSKSKLKKISKRSI